MSETGKTVIIVFEGRDAAGKGSTIKRFTEYLNPRGFKIVALGLPSEEEKKNLVRARAKNITELRQKLALLGRNGLIINGTGDDAEKIAHI